MGLGAPRKRSKLSHDPNNTAWSRSVTKFGQRILQSQGWKPGDFLGIKDAPHAKLHSAANASHIRVVHRDGNLGLGAKVGANGNDGQSTGLTMFQDLLGRLNGKSEVELENAQEARAQLRRNFYTERRWGRLRFVSGGLLVGDQIQETGKENGDEFKILKKESEVSLHGFLSRSQRAVDEKSDTALRTKKKRLKRSRDNQIVDVATIERVSLEEEGPVHDASVFGLQPDHGSHTLGVESANAKPEKAQRRAEKAERKLQRKIKRETRQATTARAPQIARASPPLRSIQEQPPDQERRSTPVPLPLEQSPKAIPSVGARGGRHVVRGRNIKHKKMAMMDSKALNEILMIRA